MATTYGSWVPNSSNNKRMRLRVDYTVPTPGAGASSVTVTGSVHVEAGYSFTDSSNTFTMGGDLGPSTSGAKSINVATNGSQQLQTFSQAVSLTGSTQTRTLTASLTGIDYVGSSYKASVSASISIPAQVAGSAPGTPASASVSRTSDTSHTISWTAGSGTVTQYLVERTRLSDSAASSVVYTDGSARSAVDTASVANDGMSWTVYAGNSAGWSGGQTTAVLYGTPAAPTDVQGRRDATDIVLSWSANAPYASGQDVQGQSSPDGVTWGAYANLSGHTGLAASVNQRTLAGLDVNLWWRFRVQVYRAGVATVQAASNVVAPLARPSAPTPLSPTGTVTSQAVTTFTWRHNPTDGSGQTSAEVRYKLGAGAWTTRTVSGGAQTVSTASNLSSGAYSWQVRTKGAHPDWSDWSAEWSLTVANPPTTSVTSPPSGSLDASRLTVGFSYADSGSSPMAGWVAQLTLGGQVVEERSGAGAASQVAFQTVLTNATSYTAKVQVRAGTGLWSTQATRTWTVSLLAPALPVVAASWLEDQGVVQLSVTTPAGSPGVAATTTAVAVERSDDAGLSWRQVVAGLGANPGWVDERVPLNVEPDVQYRAISSSSTGALRTSDPVAVPTPTSRVWLVGRDGAAAWLAGALRLDPSYDAETVREQYLGQTYPTVHHGPGRTTQVRVSGIVTASDGMGQEWPRLLGQDVHYRDPAGRAFWAVVDGVGLPQRTHHLHDVSFTVEQINAD